MDDFYHLFFSFLFSFAGLVRVGEAHSLGKSSGTGDVCLSSLPPDLPPQRFDPLLGGVASPNFQDMFIGCPGLCPSFFLVKKFSRSKVKVEKVKNSKNLSPPTVFELGCSNFQDVFS